MYLLNYVEKKTGKFVIKTLKKGISKSKEIAYISLVHPLMEYREASIWKESDQILRKIVDNAAKFVQLRPRHGSE